MQKDANLVEIEKCCQTHIYLQRSAPIQPKTSDILPKIAQKLNSPYWSTTARPRPGGPHLPGGRDAHPGGRADPRLHRGHGGAGPEMVGKIGKFAKFLQNLTEFCKFLKGSFSAVSKRSFARKYAFDSIFQALQDLHPFAPLQSQNFRKKSV